jgi:putative flippase GtrA
MSAVKKMWANFKSKHPGNAQFLVFFILSNGVTVLQLALIPILRSAFSGTSLESIPFQFFPVGQNTDGSQYHVFDYAAGAISADGTGGGLAYFLAVQISIGIAQVINFFAQRKITFKSDGSAARAAFWYIMAYIAITLAAGAAQGLYKMPLYSFLIGAMGGFGERTADVVTMIINSAISFWVFFPIFKIIFKDQSQKKKPA